MTSQTVRSQTDYSGSGAAPIEDVRLGPLTLTLHSLIVSTERTGKGFMPSCASRGWEARSS